MSTSSAQTSRERQLRQPHQNFDRTRRPRAPCAHQPNLWIGLSTTGGSKHSLRLARVSAQNNIPTVKLHFCTTDRSQSLPITIPPVLPAVVPQCLPRTRVAGQPPPAAAATTTTPTTPSWPATPSSSSRRCPSTGTWWCCSTSTRRRRTRRRSGCRASPSCA